MAAPPPGAATGGSPLTFAANTVSPTAPAAISMFRTIPTHSPLPTRAPRSTLPRTSGLAGGGAIEARGVLGLATHETCMARQPALLVHREEGIGLDGQRHEHDRHRHQGQQPQVGGAPAQVRDAS